MAARRCSICAINHPAQSVPYHRYCINCGGTLDYLTNADEDPNFAEMLARSEAEAEERKIAAAKHERFEEYYAHRAVKELNEDIAVLESEGMDILRNSTGGEFS